MLDPQYSSSPAGADHDGNAEAIEYFHMKSPSPDQNCVKLDPQYSTSPLGENRNGSQMKEWSAPEPNGLMLEPRCSPSPDDNGLMLDSQYPSSPLGEDHDSSHLEETSAPEANDLILQPQYLTSPDDNYPMLDSQYPSSPSGEVHDGSHMEESSAPETNGLIIEPRYPTSPNDNYLMLDCQYPSSPCSEDHDATQMESSSSDYHCPQLDTQYSTSYAENKQDWNRESDDSDSNQRTSARPASDSEAEQAPPETDLFGLVYKSETEYPSDPEFDSDEQDKTDTECKNDGALWKSQGLQLEENCDNFDVELDASSHVLLPVVSRHSSTRAEASYIDESSDDETPLSRHTKVAMESMPRTASAAPNTTNDEVNDDDEDSFDYRKIAETLTSQEKTSFAFHDIGLTHHVSREAVQGFRSLHPDKPFDYRTSRDRIKMLTGVAEVRYDCCVKGCISYSLPKYADLKECPIEKCKHPRYRNGSGGKLVPYAQHSYIPVAHRLRLMYSDKERAREMMEYPYQCGQDRENNIRSDFWTGELFRDLQAKGLFSLRTDVALALSSDGVKVFKTRSSFYIWPIMLVSTKSVPQRCTRF
jgi:hypothetical protein